MGYIWRIDNLFGTNNLSDTAAQESFAKVQKGQDREWLFSFVNNYEPDQLKWTEFKPLFRKKFESSDMTNYWLID
jgi:hypothetical protein